MLHPHGAHDKPEHVFAQLPGPAAATVDVTDQVLVIVLARNAFQAAGDLPGQWLQQLVARGQRANRRQVQLLELPAVAFVLAQFHLQNFDLRAQREAFGVVVEVMVGHAQAVLGEGFIAPSADAGLPGARFMTVLGQTRLRNIKRRRRVLIDRPQQFETALGALRVAFLAVGAVTFQAIRGVDDQRLAIARQCLEICALKLLLIGADLQYPLLLFISQRLGTAQQLTLPGRTILDGLDQAGLFHGLDGVGRDGREGELFGQAQARSRHLQQFKQAIGAVFVEEKIVELDLFQFPDVLDHARRFCLGKVQPVFPQVAVFQAAVFRELFLVRHQRKQPRVAPHKAFPGVKDAVVGTFDVGAEVDRITEQ